MKALMAAAAIVAVTVSALGYTLSDREIFVDHAKNHRSGHMGHALVNAGNGRILDFYSNCDGERVAGHSGYGWMEYRISDDYGKTFSKARVLPYSKRLYDEEAHRPCEKAVKAPDGRILLFFKTRHEAHLREPWSALPWLSAPTTRRSRTA